MNLDPEHSRKLRLYALPIAGGVALVLGIGMMLMSREPASVAPAEQAALTQNAPMAVATDSANPVAANNAASLGSGGGQASVASETPTALGGSGTASAVFVNGVSLSFETLSQLQRIYPVAIQPGRYWYDAVSGVYGAEGGPVAGQMMPGLNLGGPMQANASGGTSGVFINGRQLTYGETSYIEQACQTPVAQGRYWVNAQGLGGFEGGPPSFNLAACAGASSGGGGGGGGSSTRTFCDPGGSCTSTGILGSILTTP